MPESSAEMTCARWNSGPPGGLSVSLGTCTYTEVTTGTWEISQRARKHGRTGPRSPHDAAVIEGHARPMWDGRLAYFACARRCVKRKQSRRSSSVLRESCSYSCSRSAANRRTIRAPRRPHRRAQRIFAERDWPSSPVTIWPKSHETRQKGMARHLMSACKEEHNR